MGLCQKQKRVDAGLWPQGPRLKAHSSALRAQDQCTGLRAQRSKLKARGPRLSSKMRSKQSRHGRKAGGQASRQAKQASRWLAIPRHHLAEFDKQIQNTIWRNYVCEVYNDLDRFVLKTHSKRRSTILSCLIERGTISSNSS